MLAAPGDQKDLRGNSPLDLLIQADANTIHKAQQAGQVPAPQYVTTGESSVKTGDQWIVDGWKAGKPADQTLLEHQKTQPTAQPSTNMPTSTPPTVGNGPVYYEPGEYYYSFQCGTYNVAIANKDAILAAVKALPHSITLNYTFNGTEANVQADSTQPCAILHAAVSQNNGASQDPNG